MKNQAASELAKLAHKKSPRSKEFYIEMQKRSVLKRKANQLQNYEASKNKTV